MLYPHHIRRSTHLGPNLRALRLAREMSQAKLANRLRVSDMCVSNWELGKRKPSLLALEALCRVLGCSAGEVLNTPKKRP